MKANPFHVTRHPVVLRPDPQRVLIRPFLPALVVKPIEGGGAPIRVLNILSRVLSMESGEAGDLLDEVMEEFGRRHERSLREIFRDRFNQMKPLLPLDRELPETCQLLLGSYFTSEYSLESSALFNPSMVAHPDQSGMAEGCLRFVISLRATGEGHISSITFRTGMVDAAGQITLDPVSRFVTEPELIPTMEFERELFRRKLCEIGINSDLSRRILDALPETFTHEELRQEVLRNRDNSIEPSAGPEADRIVLLAQSNYSVRFDSGDPISQRIIFPFSPSQSNGIEDARFVRFTGDSGEMKYCATYTAYDGRVVLPQLLETENFEEFRICTLNGPAVQNKGLALFPRKLDGRYAMLSRQDSENIHLMFSDHLHFWHESKIILRPSQGWEFIQLGNCGSPLETPEGWLVLTHGVGPMRKYCIGAILLDLNEPERVVARLDAPLLKPKDDEREGYVPNVVYSCGGMIHGGLLILPYAISDTASRFMTVPVSDVLDAMRRL